MSEGGPAGPTTETDEPRGDPPGDPSSNPDAEPSLGETAPPPLETESSSGEGPRTDLPVRPRSRRWPAALAAVVIVAIAVIAAIGLRAPAPAPEPILPAQLLVGGPIANLSRSFFGVNVHAIGYDPVRLAGLVNATPFSVFRFSPAGEATDQIHSLVYDPSGVPAPAYYQTDAEFVVWCRWIHCDAVFQVPAEIDNATEAAATVSYVERNLSFFPTYWAIGNEPQQWTHFGIPWTQWKPTDNSTVTPAAFATEVGQYVSAMRGVDPSIKIIGIESVVGGTMAEPWFRAIMQSDGPSIDAIAYHAYPGGNGSGTASVAQFLGTLGAAGSFPANYAATVAILQSACPACRPKVFVDEFNSALGGGFGAYMTSYHEAVYVSATLVDAIRDGVDRVAFFDLEEFNVASPFALTTVDGTVRPAYTVYATFFANVSTGGVRDVSLPGAPPGTHALLTENGTHRSLLIVNANLTTGLSFPLPIGLSAGATNEIWFAWSPGEGTPSVASYGGSEAPTSVVVPAEGIGLIDFA